MPTANEKLRVVIDTNVLVSALNYPDGPPAEVLELLFHGEIEVYISPFILGEVERILREKFDLSHQRIQRALSPLRAITYEVQPQTRLAVITNKDADNRILECAVEAEADYIVSGDKRHILPLKEFQGIKILSPAEFLSSFRA